MPLPQVLQQGMRCHAECCYPGQSACSTVCRGHAGGAAARRDRRQRQLHCSRREAHVLHRRQMVDAMFRRYNFAGVQVQIQAVLTLYSQGGLQLLWQDAVCCST